MGMWGYSYPHNKTTTFNVDFPALTSRKVATKPTRFVLQLTFCVSAVVSQIPRLFLLLGALHPIRRHCTPSVRVYRHVTGAAPRNGCSGPCAVVSAVARPGPTPSRHPAPRHPALRHLARRAPAAPPRPRHGHPPRPRHRHPARREAPRPGITKVAGTKRSRRLTVGVAGFEPTASSSRTKRATKLRHTPVPYEYSHTSPKIPNRDEPAEGSVCHVAVAWLLAVPRSARYAGCTWMREASGRVAIRTLA